MKRANSGLTWIRQGHVQEFLGALAKSESITHELVDSLPRSVTRSHVRALLVEHGALPRRDEYLANYLEWAEGKLSLMTSVQDQICVRQYVKWHQQRRLSRSGPASRGQFLRAKQETTVAIDFLNWLRPRDIALAEANEATYLQWLAGGTTTRSIALRFLNWAKQRRLAPAWKETAPPVSKKAPRVAREDQKTLTELVTRSTDLGARDRAVGILTLVFAQRIESIALIARSDVKITADTVTILLGGYPIILPPPLDAPFRELMSNPDHQQTAAHPTPKWLFPGQKPGSPIDAGYLSRSMKRLFQARAARLGSLSELSKLGPAPIIAEALGYSVHTIEAHRIDSGDNYARYISARIEASPAE